jgi:beta-glucosidase
LLKIEQDSIMKKAVKITLIVIGSLILVAGLVALGGWMWLKSTFVNFEGDYAENTSIKEITIDGYTFLDRNGNGILDVYEDDRQSTSARVEDLLSQMTIEEKIHLLKGSGLASAMGQGEPGKGIPGAVGTIVPTPRLGIPTVYLSDGPAGLRIEPTREGEDRTYYATAFPIGTLLASTWNQELVGQVGDAMGNEALEYGIDVILGPGANIHRHPLCGRNFEYFSEDPVLTGMIGAAMVNGIEANGVGTSVKHFVANSQETNRNFNDAIVSDRAMREIYLKGFELIVRNSQPWTIMSSYNLVNGTYTSESRELLTDILRDEWGFEGLVMSDWFGGQDAVAQINAGNDLLEPGTKKQWNALLDGFEDETLKMESIDTSVGRILKLIIESKKMSNYSYGNNPDLEAHAKVTRQSAAEGMVLLKNEGVLPMDNSLNVALLGVTSFEFIAGGTGSGDVNEAYTISLEKGLQNVGADINLPSKNAYYTHREGNLEQFAKPEGMAAMFNPYNPPQIPYTEDQIAKIVASSDIGIFTIGRNSGEGGDRIEKGDFLLTDLEQDLITGFSRAYHNDGKKFVVVMNIGGVIETSSWKDRADAILLAWQGGQEGGNSVADILYGKVNPSGKLPMTFPINLNDHASNANFPLEGKPISMMDMFNGDADKPEEEKIKNDDYTNYEEGIYVGYRHFDKAGLDVSYPFGYGLSYSTFSFSEMMARVENDTVKISVTVTNTGEIDGKEVVQIYVSKSDPQVDRPMRELEAFSKTPYLEPGEKVIINLQFPVMEIAYWDEGQSKWVVEQGPYQLHAGTSSRDIYLTQEVIL